MILHKFSSQFTYKTLIASLVTATLLLTACRLEPPYQRPCLDIPCGWRQPTNHTSTACNIAWWRQFDDHVLNCYIRIALENNKDLKMAIHRVRQACAELCIVSSYLYPELDGNLTVLRQELSAATHTLPFGAPRTTNYYNPYLSASYEFDIWGRIRASTEAAQDALLATIEARRTVVQTVVTAVAATYMRLRQYDKQLEIARSTFKSRMEALKIAELRFEGGLTSLMEVKQSEAELLSAETSAESYIISIQKEENALCVLLGINPTCLQRGKTLDELDRDICVPMGLPSELLCRRPDIREAEDKLMETNALVWRAKALYFPQITLTGMLGAASTELSNLFSNAAQTWLYGFHLTQQIFNANRITCQVTRAKEERWEAVYNYQQTILQAFREVNDSLIAQTQLSKIIRVQTDRVSALTDYLSLANIRYDNGEVDYLNVIDAQTKLFNSQIDLAQAQGDHLISYIDLYKSLGGGWITNADGFALYEEKRQEAGCAKRRCCPKKHP